MNRIFTVFLVLLLVAGLSFAGDLNFKKPLKQAVPYTKTKVVLPDTDTDRVPNGLSGEQKSGDRLQKASAYAYHTMIDMQPNGLGWANSSLHPIDRFYGLQKFDEEEVDFLLLAYRQLISGSSETGIIGVTEIDISAGLENSTVYTFEQVANTSNMNGGIGGRYPSCVALDVPFIAYNWYVRAQDTGYDDDAAISHPYMISDWYQAYGDDGGDWSSAIPEFRMDEGYLHHDVDENRLWNGAVDVVKTGDDLYYYAGLYANWFTAGEYENEGVQSDYVVLNAVSDGPDPEFYGWIIDTDPYVIDVQQVSYLSPGLDMNTTGFGAVAGPGHLEWHHPDSGWYYNELKITYQITQDYGVNWSDPDTVSFGDLGFPLYVYSEDSLLLYYDENEELVSYEGSTFMGTNGDMDVLVTDDNTIFVAFNGLWGRPGDDGWYPSYHYSGTFIARKLEGQPWEAARIWYNNGIWEGDQYIEGRSIFFFDSEIDLAMDENGVLFATWLDRRRNNVEIAARPRYVSFLQGGTEDYKTDIYAAHSDNGGANWSEPINVSDSPSLDEYELKSSRRASGRDNGTMWLCYSIADESGASPVDAYIDLENEAWVAEASEFNPVSSIGDKPVVAVDFGLRQNYPNPFNPLTRIEFVPANSGQARLSVYNAAGELIAELFNGSVKSNASYQVEFDGTDLASGIYFYELRMAGQSEVRKMILLK
jgi:hypothetical protein